MRRKLFCTLPALLALAGCGYVGPIVPPSAQIPTAVTDLSAAERGDQLNIAFTVPANTTDGIGIREYSNIDLRIGPVPDNLDVNAWAATARHIDVAPPPAVTRHEEARPVAVSKSLPLSDWIGKRIGVAVRTAVRKEDHFSAWSNVVALKVIPPLKPPEARVEATAGGYALTWLEPQPGAQYRISRQGPNDKQPVELGTTDKSSYTDSSAHWETPYTYTVVAAEDGAESLPWTSKVQNAADIFPPSVPSDLSAFSSSDAIEITWRRSPESDLAGYFVYRSTGGAPFEKQGALVNVPSYSDHKVEHGKSYRYAVSAIDQKGNESAKSEPVEVAFP